MKKIEIEQKAKSESLEKQLNVMVESLIETKKTVDRELTQYVESKRDILHQQGKLIEIERKLLDETYSFCTKLLRCGSDIEILSMKREIEERLSKLQSSKDTKICSVEEIALPGIDICKSGNIYKMEVKWNNENDRFKPRKGIQGVAKDVKNDDNETKETNAYQDKFKTLTELDNNTDHMPYYTSVAWIDDDTIAVVDQRNQQLKLVSKGNNMVKMAVKVSNCIVVSSFNHGLACRSGGDMLHVFNSSFQLQRSFSSVSTLLTGHSQSSDLCWISGLQKICILRDNDIKEIVIYDPNSESKISDPVFGHVLLNGMFAVSDWNTQCVFLISRSGCIEKRKCFNSNPGSISSDSNHNLYMCDFQRSQIIIFSLSGESLRSVKLREIAPNPRSIALKNDQKALIANGKSIVEVEVQ